jgi:hypothetical protein
MLLTHDGHPRERKGNFEKSLNVVRKEWVNSVKLEILIGIEILRRDRI